MNCCCGQRWKPKASCRLISTDSYTWVREKLNLFNDCHENIFLCSACELSLRREHRTEIDSSEILKSADDEQCITFDQYLSPLDCQVRCCVCRVLLTSEAVELSNAARIDLLVDHTLYVSPDTRICNKHVFRSRLRSDVVVDHNQL